CSSGFPGPGPVPVPGVVPLVVRPVAPCPSPRRPPLVLRRSPGSSLRNPPRIRPDVIRISPVHPRAVPRFVRRSSPRCRPLFPEVVHRPGATSRSLRVCSTCERRALHPNWQIGPRTPAIDPTPRMATTPFPLPIMLDTADRKALRARAHHLDPVVMIGESGLTRAVLDETDRALRAHELIKVRVLGDDRAQRQAMSTEICSALGCTAVQSIGKLLVLYRPRPIEDGPRGDEPHVPKKRAAQGVTAPRKPGSRAGKATKR